jgi:hypothetical protein
LKTSRTFDSGNPTEHFAGSKLPTFNPGFDDGSWTVYHGENGLRTLRELGRSYQTISKDLTRVMNRLTPYWLLGANRSRLPSFIAFRSAGVIRVLKWRRTGVSQ